jgi:glycosyltransferase involved in cell wall biosynthesis
LGTADLKTTLSVIVPCYNEVGSLRQCVEQLLQISDENLGLEVIIIDDGSSDGSATIAEGLSRAAPEILFVSHDENRGKGAALRTGIERAGGDLIAIQDADLEYDPQDLKRMLVPITSGRADVVIGSRFISPGAHRVLYFWHSVANKFLTLLSNMLTDLNLSDMECCYKVFRAEVIKRVHLKEDRFGFEPEVIAKVARQDLRIYEMAVSYHGRTYADGKKITWKDAVRALYCILHYNLPYAPPLLQFLFYLFVGAVAAVANLIMFLGCFAATHNVVLSAPIAFVLAALLNYYLCICFIFRHKARWRSIPELLIYFSVVVGVGLVDVLVTANLMGADVSPAASKAVATMATLLLNFLGRRYIVFPLSARL